MAEKNASKIKYFGKVLIDLTEDTVAPETLSKGVTAHDKTGAQITGTAETAEPIVSPLTVTANGTYTAPDDVDGYSPIIVEVTFSAIYTGSAVPDNTVGADGDIFLVIGG